MTTKTNIQLPQISLDWLLQLKVGEEGNIIVPIDSKHKDIDVQDDLIYYERDTPESNCISGYFSSELVEDFIKTESPLQKDEEFYVGEDLYGAIDTKTLTLSGEKVGYSTVTTAKRYPELKDEDFIVFNVSKKEAELEKSESEHIYNLDATVKRTKEASQMTPEQSRLHGVCVDVEVHKYMDICSVEWDNNISKLHSFKKGNVMCCGCDDVDKEDYYNILVSQHNALHNTNIEPSLDDYVFYITIKRT